MFRIIICGGRDFSNYPLLRNKCIYFLSKKRKEDIVIICGKANGADTLGEKFAKENNYKIEYFPANWEKYGKSAGFIRNKEMIDIADAVIAFWNGESKGTENTISLAKEKNIPLRIVYY